MQAETILDFWFKEATPEQWFKQDETFDHTIRNRFFEIHQCAASGGIDEWTNTPVGALALVIILDQFSRNLFRGSEQTYATDAKALAIAKTAIASGFDSKLESKAMRKFLFMPFMHSEEPEVQNQGLRYFERLDDPQTLKFANHHRDIIARFGRFPHRNKVLNRNSTSEEIEFLRSEN